MLRNLDLLNVGPTHRLRFDPFASRLNLITGDNGLGKSFLLDIAWWALTRTWADTPAVPHAPDAQISFSFDKEKGIHSPDCPWSIASQTWRRKIGRPPNPGLVLYAGIDGSFSVWDPARNYRLYRRADGGQGEAPAAYRFQPHEVFGGLRRRVQEGGQEREQVVCLGLIEEWVRWQERGAPQFELLRRLLKQIGPEGEPLLVGEPVRPGLDDARTLPTVRMPYGQDVPLTYAPAGVKRLSKLAYLLAWAFSEHRTECERLKIAPSRQIIVLLDEPETHLHPRWQRTILPGLMEAIRSSHAGEAPEVQFLVATHSPLVLASVEAAFDPAQDALWKLDLVRGASGAEVRVEKDAWRKRGDVGSWLVSDVFDLAAPCSVEAQRAMERAGVLMARADATETEAEAVRAELRRALADTDPFWLGWRYWLRAKGWGG